MNELINFLSQQGIISKILRFNFKKNIINKQSKQKHPFGGFQVKQSPSQRKSISSMQKANFTIFKDKQPKLQTNWRGKAYFQCTIMAFRPLFKASILICLQILEEADRQHADDSFWLFYGLQSLNGRNSASCIYPLPNPTLF